MVLAVPEVCPAVPVLFLIRKLYTGVGLSRPSWLETISMLVTWLLSQALFLLAYHSFASKVDSFQAALFQPHVAMIITAPVPVTKAPQEVQPEQKNSDSAYCDVDLQA